MPRASSSFLVASVLVLGLAPAACSGAREDGTEAAAPSPAGSGAVPSPSGTATGQADAEAPVGDAGPQGTYDSKLYVLPQSSFPVTGIGAAIDSLVAAKPAIEGVLVYVQGRSCGGGGEPQKSLESVVPDMETEYAAGVVMFSWPGSDDGCPLGFPEPQARKAGPALRAALASLASYAATSPAALAQRKVTLITHSMGNIVLESALATKTGAPPNLLANAVVQSSAEGFVAALDGERSAATARGCRTSISPSARSSPSTSRTRSSLRPRSSRGRGSATGSGPRS